jgi:hypothetical protein
MVRLKWLTDDGPQSAGDYDSAGKGLGEEEHAHGKVNAEFLKGILLVSHEF